MEKSGFVQLMKVYFILKKKKEKRKDSRKEENYNIPSRRTQNNTYFSNVAESRYADERNGR